jgi:16S rRNA A1518/A1519 N6-dimethyltransferase RsmA/KsgA/DIM1 with predicted DNA glycosylase/AP lyase activity
MISTVFLLFHLLFALLMLFLTLSFFTGAPYVPSSKKVTVKMIEFAKPRKNSTVIDLGSGDGRLLFWAARQGARSIGYEINPFLVFGTWIRKIIFHRTLDVSVIWGNFWNADLTRADAVFIYLIPSKMDRLAAKLQTELRPGSIIVSNSFIFPNWPIYKQDAKLHVYAFKVPKITDGI